MTAHPDTHKTQEHMGTMFDTKIAKKRHRFLKLNLNVTVYL
jgi:hypothetical protein